MDRGETPPSVLILGAGINGACVARELALNGVPVVIVDRHDLATGATAKSSRLIHGGLRYLEYGDVSLVRESLNERARLLRLAPHFVRPLRLHIPVARRTGGLIQAAFRFFKLTRIAAALPFAAGRGLWAVRTGLWMYDILARNRSSQRYRVNPVGQPGLPRVDPQQYRWLCSYSDAQILAPERFVLALLEDARAAAAQRGTPFDLLTYHTASIDGAEVLVRPIDGAQQPVIRLRPATIVNATGSWGDRTLKGLGVASKRLFGGTKGSHIITSHAGLRDALGEDGVYAETADERLVFLLPFEGSVLVGTTDVRFDEDPADAVASTDELGYLLEMVNTVFPGVNVGPEDVTAHYCGVRPLPYVATGKTGAIPRGHSIVTGASGAIPIDTLIGGKLTTCRAFGEEAADRILTRLGVVRTLDTRDRFIPGGDRHPATPEELTQRIQTAAERLGWSTEQAAAVWRLFGTRIEQISGEIAGGSCENIASTELPVSFVDWVIRHEWASRLEDLLERRLMLAWDRRVTRATLTDLAARLVAAGRLDPAEVPAEIERARIRLARLYGLRIDDFV